MNDMCGTDHRDIAHQGVAHQGVAHQGVAHQGVAPQGVALGYLRTGALPLQSPNGAPYASPGHRPGYGSKRTDQALKGRPKPCPNPRPNGRTVRPQGVALGYLRTGALPLKMERKLL